MVLFTIWKVMVQYSVVLFGNTNFIVITVALIDCNMIIPTIRTRYGHTQEIYLIKKSQNVAKFSFILTHY